MHYTLVAGLLARSQYPEGPATGHLGTGFSWFPCAYKQTLRWFPRFQVVTTCFSCSPPDLNLLDLYFIFTNTRNNHCHRATAHLHLIFIIIMYCSVTGNIPRNFLDLGDSTSANPGSLYCITSRKRDSYQV